MRDNNLLYSLKEWQLTPEERSKKRMEEKLETAASVLASRNMGAQATLKELSEKCQNLYGYTDKANSEFMDYVFTLDSVGAYNEKLYKLYNDACHRDTEMLIKTIEAFREGKISREEIQENLNRSRAVPFF